MITGIVYSDAVSAIGPANGTPVLALQLAAILQFDNTLVAVRNQDQRFWNQALFPAQKVSGDIKFMPAIVPSLPMAQNSLYPSGQNPDSDTAR
jgi:hypothetical protein